MTGGNKNTKVVINMLICYYWYDNVARYYSIDVYKDKRFIRNYIFKDMNDMNLMLTKMYESEYELVYMGVKK